jgi:Na+-transporting methylmalonyl-CoA/oxaloacetate decarboxylase gamma subunit
LGLIISFTLLSFLIMLAVEGVLIGMLLGRKRNAKKAGDSEQLKAQAAKELGDKARVLPEPALSVTEHTTRTLEPVGTQHKAE